MEEEGAVVVERQDEKREEAALGLDPSKQIDHNQQPNEANETEKKEARPCVVPAPQQPKVRLGVRPQLCRFWRGKEGSCQRGDACRFLHQDWDRRNHNGPPVCAFFTSAGGCKWGRACRFDHSVVKLIEATGPTPRAPRLREQTRQQRRTVDANLRRLGGGPKPAAATQAEAQS